MAKEKTPNQVFEELSKKGEYEEAHIDKDEISSIWKMTIEDYGYGKSLRKVKEQNWRVIFNVHYDVVRELCGLLMRFKRQKTSNHQGLFAFIILNFPELELDWDFFERIRGIRNRNKYVGMDITKESWKSVEVQADLYVSAISKAIEESLKKL